jgi:hypothetical protein
MASILELYQKSTPVTGKIDPKGKDKTPINSDGGKNLSKDEKILKKARGGNLNTLKYSDTIKSK